MLSDKEIEIFKRDGVLVVPDVLSNNEINNARNEFHKYLKNKYNIDHNLLLEGDKNMIDLLEGPRIKSPISNIFYKKWKLDIALHPKVWQITSQLWEATYANQAKGFSHIFKNFNPKEGYALIDRVCYRTPDYIRSEGGLLPHLDRNPYDPYLIKQDGLTKWRPIQSFVSLVDQYGGKSGGLKCVKGFHLEVDEYFKKSQNIEYTNGEFYRLAYNHHVNLYNRCQPIDAPAGSMVLWDNRIVHATCKECELYDTREVVYTSFLPKGVLCNDNYIKKQTQNIKENSVPYLFKKRVKNMEEADRDWEIKDLSPLQKKLLNL